MSYRLLSSLVLVFSVVSVAQATPSAGYEFLHWWTSDGEEKALHTMTSQLKNQGVPLEVKSVKGGGGEPALSVLQTRVLAGNMPEMALVEGVNIQSWAKLNLVHNLSLVANEEQWLEKLYPLVSELNTMNQDFVAVPLNIHRMNWLWANQALLSQLQLTTPTTWKEFIAVMQAAKSRGITPLALGNDPWQVAQIFENIVLSLGGRELYYAALVKLEPEALASDTIVRALNIFRAISEVQPLPLQKLSWSQATLNLAQGKALMQVGGDWVLGELNTYDQALSNYVSCHATPGTEQHFLYNMDSVIFLRSKYMSSDEAQSIASHLQSPLFQYYFNLDKGSIPVQPDIGLEGFHACQKRSKQDFLVAQKMHKIVPSMSDSMALDPNKQRIFNLALYRYFIYQDQSPEELVSKLLSLSRT